MKDKRGTKRSHSPSKDGSSSSSNISMPPSSPSGSPPPLGSAPEVSSRRLRSPIFEQGGPSERIPVVDLSSDEEDLFFDTSHEEEFTRKLFGDLNRDLLGPPGDGNAIIISDSDKEKEADEEDIANTNVVPPSAMKFSTPAASTNDADDTFEGVLDDSNDGYTPDWTQGNNSSNGDEVDSP
jgi:hypothetical protein